METSSTSSESPPYGNRSLIDRIKGDLDKRTKIPEIKTASKKQLPTADFELVKSLAANVGSLTTAKAHIDKQIVSLTKAVKLKTPPTYMTSQARPPHPHHLLTYEESFQANWKDLEAYMGQAFAKLTLDQYQKFQLDIENRLAEARENSTAQLNEHFTTEDSRTTAKKLFGFFSRPKPAPGKNNKRKREESHRLSTETTGLFQDHTIFQREISTRLNCVFN